MASILSALNILIVHYGQHAPWVVFLLPLLAGCGFPVSIDLVVVTSAALTATIIPKLAWALYFSLLSGCYLSAWVAYWVGRKYGLQLLKMPFLRKMLPSNRVERIRLFYQKHGCLTLLVGRFIPFGVRNCLFITAGMSRLPFGKFMMQDGLACALWTSVLFFSSHLLSKHCLFLPHYLFIFNLGIFCLFAITVIGIICYKRYTLIKRALVSQKPPR